MSDPVRSALAELVAVDDLYHMAAPGVDKETWDARETAAWAAARAALAALPPASVQGPVCPICGSTNSDRRCNDCGGLFREQDQERLAHSGSAAEGGGSQGTK